MTTCAGGQSGRIRLNYPACPRAVAGAPGGRGTYTDAVATEMPTGPPGDPPQLEELLGEPWRAQVTQLRRYVRKTRDIGVAELLSLAFEAVVTGDTGAAHRYLTDAGLLAAPASVAVPPSPAVEAAPVHGPVAAPVRTPSTPRPTATVIRKPLTGQARVPAAGPVLIATDGSCSGDGRHCSWAFLATSGHWGCQAGDYRHDNVNGGSGALVAELRAVYLALRFVAGPATLLVDSTIALRYLRLWQRGETGRMPPQYDLHPRRQGTAPALVTLAGLVRARGDELTTAHVKGHAGHTLNEGADLLATIARRWVAASEALPQKAVPQKAMHAEAADIAATFLAQWHRENPWPGDA
jgi:ribonuclease HI